MKLKNIIFDLGGVLLEIDYYRTVEAFRRLGLSGSDHQFTKERQTEVFQAYEKGNMDDRDFLEALASHMPGVKQAQISEAWCALLGEMPLGRMDLLEKLTGEYRLFVLSNTNHIHQLQFEKTIDLTIGWDRFAAVFDHIGYSHQLHMRKPDAEIFEKMLDLNGLEAAETFFVDDTEEHVIAARGVGIQAHHLVHGEDIQEVFNGW